MEIMPIKMSSLLSLKKRGKRILNIWNEYFTLSVETNKQTTEEEVFGEKKFEKLEFCFEFEFEFFLFACLFLLYFRSFFFLSLFLSFSVSFFLYFFLSSSKEKLKILSMIKSTFIHFE